MKIMVCLKQVPHQDARLDISADGTWIAEDSIKFEINSYDTYALEEALRVKDAGEADVLVVSIGPDRVTQALRTALGMGADRAIHVKDPEIDGSDSLGIAKVLAAIAKQESPDLIFTGLMSEDGNFAAVPPMLAQLTGLPHTTAAVKVERANGSVTCDREIEGGAHEVVELQAPLPRGRANGHQPGPLRLAQGHHGGQEEALGRQDRRGPRDRRAGWRGRRKNQDREDRSPPEGRPRRDSRGLHRRRGRRARHQDQGAGPPLRPSSGE
jgi:hypothetical protein